ncbi:P-loop containing nucleoside triphosphate hydrolase protein [Thamnocephalis sphaerospora]|uniref:P-loop containing nucleoside triphosphate hydrolase protein n=1 Tax=Thamnocephalis sphaerospora TaxID=78915 RepID=A0A4P9XSB1_9FUNG|nr:P-loop containing nucleoside triphosphate hydrolase protein [Thamnocephalis sphaerospora]|eukprot:RKP08998.1 P-loop containing nucleoside triphosphate hydrolase protein [Thamnocephalis sphaerospora]
MDAVTVGNLADELVPQIATLPPEERFLLGVPGAGKSWLAKRLVAEIDARLGPATAVVAPMDGFHLTKAELAAMPDPALAFERRGADWTFDVQGFVDMAARVKRGEQHPVTAASGPAGRSSSAIAWPGFDHAVGDPVPGSITILPSHRLVVVEGLYLALDRQPWSSVAYDALWLVDVEDWSVARDRLVRRHQEAGIVNSAEEALARAEGNDRTNAELIEAMRRPNVRLLRLASE